MIWSDLKRYRETPLPSFTSDNACKKGPSLLSLQVCREPVTNEAKRLRRRQNTSPGTDHVQGTWKAQAPLPFCA